MRRPRISSERPPAYESALSKKFPPASRNDPTIFSASLSSHPQPLCPKVMVPRQSLETRNPLEPRSRTSIADIPLGHRFRVRDGTAGFAGWSDGRHAYGEV